MHGSTEKKATVVIAGVLVAGTLIFAGARSRHLPESGVAEPSGTAATASPAAAPVLGGALYRQECGACHGSGRSDSAEVGRSADDIYRRDQGAGLVDLLLRGGEDEDHPPFDHLGDEQLAALLAYLLAYGDADGGAASGARPAISADEVAALRVRR